MSTTHTNSSTEHTTVDGAVSLSPKRAYHHGNLRAALIDAGLKIVEEKGIDGLTIRDLARAVGVSHAAPAYHFSDKEDIVLALATAGFQRLMERFSSVPFPDNPVERLELLGITYMEFALDHPNLYQVMFGARDEERCVDADYVTNASRTFGALRDFVADAIRVADLPFDVEAVVLGAWGMVHGIVSLHANRALQGPRPEYRDLELVRKRMREALKFFSNSFRACES